MTRDQENRRHSARALFALLTICGIFGTASRNDQRVWGPKDGRAARESHPEHLSEMNPAPPFRDPGGWTERSKVAQPGLGGDPYDLDDESFIPSPPSISLTCIYDRDGDRKTTALASA